MNKREICERLMSIHNSVMFASNGSGDIGGNPCYGVGNAIRELILDIVARETEEKPKAEEVPIPETPLLWVDGNAPLSPCPKCGANCPKLDERTSGLPGAVHYCQSCHAYFVTKREEKREEEGK